MTLSEASDRLRACAASERRPANDNWLGAAEIHARLAWVRPVAAAMRAAAIPEDVVQGAMRDLLHRLDMYLDGVAPGHAAE